MTTPPIKESDWQWLIDRPRLLRTWSPTREGSTAALMVSTLKMAEDAPDDLVLPLHISLGELRNHVQWCQIAGNVLETAISAQDYFISMELKQRRDRDHIKKLETMLASAGVDPPKRPYAKTDT